MSQQVFHLASVCLTRRRLECVYCVRCFGPILYPLLPPPLSQRRKDDLLTEVDVVRLLETVHPVYRLPSDSLTFLLSLLRALITAFADKAAPLLSHSPPPSPELLMNGAGVWVYL